MQQHPCCVLLLKIVLQFIEGPASASPFSPLSCHCPTPLSPFQWHHLAFVWSMGVALRPGAHSSLHDKGSLRLPGPSDCQFNCRLSGQAGKRSCDSWVLSPETRVHCTLCRPRRRHRTPSKLICRLTAKSHKMAITEVWLCVRNRIRIWFKWSYVCRKRTWANMAIIGEYLINILELLQELPLGYINYFKLLP